MDWQSGDLRLMTDSKTLKAALRSVLLDCDFKKKSDSWYWSNDTVVLVVNLQKSQYGPQYYVNCGVALKSLGAVAFPKEHHCHIRFRLTGVVSDKERMKVESVFDLENSRFSDQERREEITKLIRTTALPILKGCTSVDGMSEVTKSGKLANAMIHKRVRNLIY